MLRSLLTTNRAFVTSVMIVAIGLELETLHFVDDESPDIILRQSSLPVLTIERPIVDRFPEMNRSDDVGTFEVSDRAGDSQDLVVSAG